MKAKLIVEGREFPIEIQDPELQKLLMPQKATGYERVVDGNTYYLVNNLGNIITLNNDSPDADLRYECANYYSDRIIAENNARADKLMRQLRRFAVENGGIPSVNDWKDNEKSHNSFWSVVYDYPNKRMCILENSYVKYFGTICFNSVEAAKKVMETFRDELIWYFTEYKDSL